jgi:hypothetical protein
METIKQWWLSCKPCGFVLKGLHPRGAVGGTPPVQRLFLTLTCIAILAGILGPVCTSAADVSAPPQEPEITAVSVDGVQYSLEEFELLFGNEPPSTGWRIMRRKPRGGSSRLPPRKTEMLPWVSNYWQRMRPLRPTAWMQTMRPVRPLALQPRTQEVQSIRGYLMVNYSQVKG